MAQRGRPGLLPAQKRELWRRWKAGESLSEIGRALGRQAGSIHGVVAANGGYLPSTRRRSARVLSVAEREEISLGLAGGLSVRAITPSHRRASSTISREIARHGGRAGYRASAPTSEPGSGPGGRSRASLRVPRGCASSWPPSWSSRSPEQISGWLAQTYPGEQALHVSTETIYRSLFIQARGVLRKELTAHLRTRRTMRRSKHATAKGQGRGGIVDAVSIRERSAEVEVRAVPGHWEGDLLAGSANTHIATWSRARPATCSWSGSPARTPPPSWILSRPRSRPGSSAPRAPHLGPRH